MLTIKGPIELTCQTGMVSSWEGFYHRICGNYQMISAGIHREDLLHVAAVPPEVYIGEGGMTSLVNQTAIQNTQETKLEIINNLLNRVALTENIALTYQDRVYITDVLKKLGIENVNQFMTQVARLKQETQTTKQLISLYGNHLEELTQMVEEYRYEEKKSEVVTENVRRQQELYLHEDIMNRLRTGAVYQILHHFYSSYNGSSQYVASQELQITEQKRVSSHILLNQLRNEAQDQKASFVYRRQNHYETMDMEESQITSETVSAQITSAVLLNLIDNLYFSRFERQKREGQVWLHIENALYQTAANTLWRMKNETTGRFLTRERKELLSQYQRQVHERELQALCQLLAISREVPAEPGREEEGFPFQEHEQERGRQEADIRYPDMPIYQEGDVISGDRRDFLFREYRLKLKRQVERYMETVRSVWFVEGRTEGQEPVPMEAGKPYGEEGEGPLRDHREKMELPLPYPGQPQGSESVNLYYGQSADRERENWVREPADDRQGEDRIREKETNKILSQSQMVKTQPVIYWQEPESRILRETDENTLEQNWPGRTEVRQANIHVRQGDENITAVDRTEKFFAEYENRISRKQSDIYHDQERQNQILTETYKSPLKQGTEQQTEGRGPQVSVYQPYEEHGAGRQENHTQQTLITQEEYLEQIRQQLKQINQQNIENFNRYQEIFQQQEKQKKTLKPTIMQMRRESLKALENPEELLEDYRQEHEAEKQRQTEEKTYLTRLLPEQTKKIYEQLEQYQNSRGQAGRPADMTESSIGLLLHDIRQIQQENHTKQQVIKENTEQRRQMSETVIERWEERQEAESKVQRQEDTERNDISLVHKSLENQVDEEFLQQIIEQNRSLSAKIQVSERQEEERHIVQTTVHQKERQTLVKETGDLTELIQKGVQKQIGAISDQIYTKLEKRLQNEKKRRGY